MLCCPSMLCFTLFVLRYRVMQDSRTADVHQISTPIVRLWLLGNPTSSGGKGLQHLTSLHTCIVKILREINDKQPEAAKDFMKLSCSDFIATTKLWSSDIHNATSLHLLLSVMRHDSTAADRNPSYGLGGDVSQTVSCEVSALIHPIEIHTEASGDGKRLANRISELVVADHVRWCDGKVAEGFASEEGCGASRGYPFLDIIVVVGGDGTLGEAVGGSCSGVLSAYHKWCDECMSSEASQKKVGEADASPRHPRVLADKEVLKVFSPFFLYYPCGTGADFSRMGICCSSTDQFAEILREVCEACASSRFTRDSIGLNLDWSGAEALKNGVDPTKTKGFAVSYVDVGRIGFLKTGRVEYFINECSCGMSVDVIQKSNAFRKHTVLSALGGPVIFAGSAFMSLVQMNCSWIRMMRLPPRQPTPQCSFFADKDGTVSRLFTFPETISEALQCTTAPSSTLREGGLEHVISAHSAGIREELDMVSLPTEAEGAIDVEWQPRWVYFQSSTIAFGNGRWYGGGLQVAPHANPTDGLLSVTRWLTSFCRFVGGARDLYTGKHHRWSSTSVFDGERYLLDSGPLGQMNAASEEEDAWDSSRGAQTTLLEADGELLDSLPAIIEVGGCIPMISSSRARFSFGCPIRGTRRYDLLSHNSSLDGDACGGAVPYAWMGSPEDFYSP